MPVPKYLMVADSFPQCPLQGLYTEMKFEKPSRIQAKTLPMILQPPYRSLIAQVRLHLLVSALGNPYCHLIAQGNAHVVLKMARNGTQAHNGSGKTTCFTLAMLSRVDPRLNQPQALCLCPTRYEASLGSAPVLCKALVVQSQMLKCLQGAGVSECHGFGKDGKVHRYQGNLNDCSCLLPQASGPLYCTTEYCWQMRLLD